MVAPNADCRAGSATLTTVPSMNAILEPSIVVAIIQPPLLPECLVHEPDRMTASSQAGFTKGGTIHPRKNGRWNLSPANGMYEKRVSRYRSVDHRLRKLRACWSLQGRLKR